MSRLQARVQALWYARSRPPGFLRLLAALYGRLARGRRQRLLAQQCQAGCPVIVVGNISVGGTGKTPFVIWLVGRLRDWGFRPGVVARGYGGRAPAYPHRVRADDDPALCGDEPLLVARRTGVPVIVDPDRVAAARQLVASGEVDVIVADDGLQHYRLARDREFCVVDGARGLGNRALLPAGPLREPPARLADVDFLVVNGPGGAADDLPGSGSALRFELVPGQLEALDGTAVRPLDSFAGQRVHAVAGIGHPARFFATLRAAGLDVIEHAFPDHHRYVAADLEFGDRLPVVMTEKDAVKCRVFARTRGWMLPVEARLAATDEQRVRVSCEALRAART